MERTDAEVDRTWEQVHLATAEGDHRKLVLLLKRLDRLGIWRATARIGEFYELGAINVDQDLNEAAKWYKKAIFESDDPIAHLGLGRIYYEGCSSVGADLEKSRIHLTKAFSGGAHQAGIHLGQMNMFGMGIEQDLAEARRYFLAAAAAGFPIAYSYLASLAATSGNGIDAILMLLRGYVLTLKLKLQDWHHPNLWQHPKK